MFEKQKSSLKKIVSHLWYEQSKECLLCGKQDHDVVCHSCQLEYFQPALKRCLTCGKLLTKTKLYEVCDDCRNGKGPQNVAKVFSLGYYGGEWKNFIHRVKFQGQPYLLIALVDKLIPLVIKELPPPDIITFVPLHSNRLAERGFNQAEVLASVLSRKLGLKCEQVLCRIKETVPQTLLGRNERLNNLHGAFTLLPGITVDGRLVWVVDDVVTTGATIGECATVLMNNGAEKVYGVCLAAGKEK